MFIKIILNIIFLLYFANCDKQDNNNKDNKDMNKLLSNTYKYRQDLDYKLQPGPIYAKSWVKYYSSDIQNANKLNDFFKNFAFYDQFKGGVVKNLNLADEVYEVII